MFNIDTTNFPSVKKTILLCLIALAAGFIFTFLLQHFGTFRYINATPNNDLSNEVLVEKIIFVSPVSEEITTTGKGLTYNDVLGGKTGFDFYKFKLPYFIEATLKSWLGVLMISLSFFYFLIKKEIRKSSNT